MREFDQTRDAWDVDTLVPIGDLLDAGDRVVARYFWRGAGRGPEADLELTSVYTLRRQKIVFQEIFRDHAEALETVGLQE